MDVNEARAIESTSRVAGEAAFHMLLQVGKESWHTMSFYGNHKTLALVRGTP